MKYTEYQKKLKETISLLSEKRKIEFAIDICIRLFPEYEKFQKKYDWGDSAIIWKGIKYCQNNYDNSRLDKKEVQKLMDEIDSLIPDMDDFGELQGSYGLNASLSVYECLEYLIIRENKKIINIATYMYDTIDFKVQFQNEELTEKEIREHPKIIEEINWQLTVLENTDSIQK